MAIQRIEYTQDKNAQSSLWKHLLFWCSSLFSLGWLYFNNVLNAAALAAVGIFPTALSLLVSNNQLHRSKFKSVKAHFSSHGLIPDFELKPVILVDSKSRKLAYFNNAGNWYELMDLADIRSWEHTWVDHTENTPNAWGDKVTSTMTQKDNVLLLKTNNPHQPIYKIYLRNYAQGELWIARLSALIKG